MRGDPWVEMWFTGENFHFQSIHLVSGVEGTFGTGPIPASSCALSLYFFFFITGSDFVGSLHGLGFGEEDGLPLFGKGQ